jgi:isovaleryl-CoA dehydrogenase
MNQTSGRTFDLFTPSVEHEMLRSTVKNFAEKELEAQAAQFDREEKFNLPLFRTLGDLGLLGITVDPNYGGTGMDAVAAVIAHEELSAVDPGFCLAYLAHSMLCVNNISMNASSEQCAQVLPKLCSGEWIGAMGMSEPGCGTDVLGMATEARREGDHFILNGRKMWITNGTIDENRTPCDVLLVYSKTGFDVRGRPELSTFIVKAGDEGFSVGQKITDKLGMRASNTAELCFDNCILGSGRLVGEVGSSLEHMMRNLELERLTLAAMALGIAKRALQCMVTYAAERKAFGQALHSFGQIQAHIGESYANFMAARSYVYGTARSISLDKGGQRLDSDGVKLFAARVAKDIADRAIQVLGGYGYVGEYKVERLWRDAKLLEIGGGTNEAHQKNITRELIKAL